MISFAKTIERLPLSPIPSSGLILVAYSYIRCFLIRSFPSVYETRRFPGAMWNRIPRSLDNLEVSPEDKAGVILPATDDHIEEEIQAIKTEQIIAVPTDTLYGFACDACARQGTTAILEQFGLKEVS